jgi:[methyl-Co(III) methanol-specific corrinoid protein]:coenzyme M methyltransferase
MHYSAKKELSTLLRGGEIGYFPRIIPINPPFVDVMRSANIFWPEAHKDSTLMAGLASACNDILGFRVMNVPFDMTVEAEALGVEIVYKSSITSILQVKECKREDLRILEFGEKIMTKGRFPVVSRAVKLLCDENESEVSVVPFIEGPFTVACLVVGINAMYKAMIKDRAKAQYVLEKLTDLSILYAQTLLASGADSIIVLDPNVMGLTEKQFTEMIHPVYKKLTQKIELPIILHICGNVSPLLNALSSTGFSAFSFDFPAVSIKSVKSALGGKMKIIGSVPTITHLLNGTKKEVLQTSLQLIDEGVDMLAPSCFVAPETPLENVKAMGEAVEIWNRKHG